ncbi:uncharacterized protein G2W53_009994 [Senna tora]|uniref:Uncharacterized protein n=1 Tax=Senna tora TaxID=362788 RepID=A0A834WZL9_9FABA|nr:uncharacterized protein G2W53_009994 [Senna tora]
MLRLESSWHGRSVDHVLTYSGQKIAVGFQKPSRITRQKTCCASESNTSVRVVFAYRSGFDAPIGVVLAWEERGSCLKIFRTKNRGRISETFTNYEAKDLLRKNLHELRGKRLVAQVSQTRRFALYSRTRAVLMLRLESSWHGRSVDHVLTYSGRQIAVGSQKPSQITRQKTCCASESNSSVRTVFVNRSGFDAPIGVVFAWEERGSCLNIFRMTNHGRISEAFTNYEAKDSLPKNHHELRGKRLIAQVSQTRRFENQSGFDAPIGVVLAWEERGSCLNIFRTKNRGRISKTFTNYEAKDLLRKSVDHVLTYSGQKIAVGFQKPSQITRQKTCCASESNTSVRVVFANRSGFDAPIGVVLAWEEHGSCREIFRTTNCGLISETFTNYEAKDLLRKSVDHVLTYSGRQIAVRSQKPSRITRQKTCCASESNTSVRVVFANGSGFDAPIGVVLAWEERGSCLNIFRTTNRGRISETFTNYEAKDLLRNRLGMGGAWIMSYHISDDKSRSYLRNLHNYEAKDLLRKSEDLVVIYSGRQIEFSFRKPSRITRQSTCCASESNSSVRVVFANGSGFDAPSGVVLAWEARGSCFHIFRTRNRGRILETFTNYEHGRSVDHVLTYSGRQIAVGSQKPSRITRAKTCCTSESNTSVRVVFANLSGFDAPIEVVLAWEERGSCLNIFRTTNCGRISKTFTNYEAKDLLRKNVDHVLTYSGRQIAVGSQKPSRITRQKTCCASQSNTSVLVLFANGSGFDAPIGVALAWEALGSCLNIFRTTNRGRISEIITNYEAKLLLRKNLHELRGKRLVAQVSQKRRFANRSGFDAPIAVVLAWEERGSCLNIFRTANRGRISETLTNYEAKDLLRKKLHELRGKRLVPQVSQTHQFALYSRTRVVLMLRLESSWHGRSEVHVLTDSGRQIAVGSQKPSRITRQKTCCASESNTSVRVVLANRSGFDALIGVVLAWEERGSCLNIFRTTNHGRISETFTNYEAKDLLRSESNTSVRVVFANGSGFNAPIGVVLAWVERGSCLNIFRMTNRGRISETFTNYEAKDLLRNESNTSIRVVFANGSGFDAPIGAVLAWHERGSCLNIFQTTNHSRISETFTNYEAKDLLRKNLHELRGKRLEAQVSQTRRFANGSGFDAPIGVVLAWEERGSCLHIYRTANRGRISETFTNYEAKDLLRK